MKERLLMPLTCIALSIGSAWAQNQSVSGIVISEESGEPIIGASVLVKGTTQGTVTDMDGKFTIPNLPNSAKVLQVSYVGMEGQEVTIKNGIMRIVLKSDSELLDEVMVVAFGTQKKSSFTGSASVVSSEDLSKHVATNVANALVGSTPGLQLRGGSGAPGAGQGSIKIRGIASMYANTDPLIIVDGAPYSASLSNIPQDDIESVTVLKDAASAALYGARGAAGVILVTTKTGANKKAQINVDVTAAEKELEKSIKNEDLLRLMKLQKTLVYFNTSIRGNEVLIGKLKTIFSDTDYLDADLVEDVVIELKQAYNTVNIYSDILTGTMDAFASIISNNVNDIMKRMTSLSITLMIPTVIASFYGMNVDIHLESFPHAFLLIVLLSAAISAGTFVWFRKIKWF